MKKEILPKGIDPSKLTKAQNWDVIAPTKKKRRIESTETSIRPNTLTKRQGSHANGTKVRLDENFKNRFVKSLVPQAVIDSTGTILYYNEPFEELLRHCFASTLSSSPTRRVECIRAPLSIFALVEMDQLATLFKSFSEALRICSSSDKKGLERSANKPESRGHSISSASPAPVNIIGPGVDAESSLNKNEKEKQEWRCTFPCQNLVTYNKPGQGQERRRAYCDGHLQRSTGEENNDRQQHRLNLSLTILSTPNICSNGIYFLGVCTEHSIETDS